MSLLEDEGERNDIICADKQRRGILDGLDRRTYESGDKEAEENEDKDDSFKEIFCQEICT